MAKTTTKIKTNNKNNGNNNIWEIYKMIKINNNNKGINMGMKIKKMIGIVGRHNNRPKDIWMRVKVLWKGLGLSVLSLIIKSLSRNIEQHIL